MRAKTLTEIFLIPTLVCIHCKLTLYAATHDRVTDFMLGMCSNKGIEVFFFILQLQVTGPNCMSYNCWKILMEGLTFESLKE